MEEIVNNQNQSPNGNVDDVFLMPAIPPLQLDISPIQKIPQRRSRRVSRSLVDTSNNPRPVRRSIRLQSLEMERPTFVEPSRRRSIRIHSLTNEMNISTNKVVKPKSKINPLTDYFRNGPTRKVGIQNARKHHKDSILKLLNKGTLKELQILPLIGLKTAYQIIFQRLVLIFYFQLIFKH